MSGVIELARRNMGLTALVVAGLGLLILNPFFYVGWQSAGAEQTDLEKREMMANLQLANAQATYELSALQVERNELIVQLNALENTPNFPTELPSADLYTEIAQEAGYSGVTVSSVDAAETPGTEEIGETSYSRSEVDLTLEGSLSQIRAFLSRMEAGEFATLRFEDVNLTMVEETQTWEGQVTLVVLSQR